MESGHYYNMRGVSGGLGKTKNGAPQLAVSLVVTEEDCQGESITYYGYFTDKSKGFTFTALRTLGWEGDDLSNLAGLDKNEVRVLVAEEEYEGKFNMKVKGIYPLGGAGLVNPMTEAEAKAFAATMKGDVIAARSDGGTKPADKPKGKSAPKNGTRRQAADAPPDDFNPDDDIPF